MAKAVRLHDRLVPGLHETAPAIADFDAFFESYVRKASIDNRIPFPQYEHTFLKPVFLILIGSKMEVFNMRGVRLFLPLVRVYIPLFQRRT